MMIILITLWFNGYNISIDANQMYNISTMEECHKILPKVRNAWGSTRGVCMIGDIKNPTEGI